MSSAMSNNTLASISERMATENLIYGLNSFFIVISAICLGLRVYSRTFIVKAVGADDAMAVVAFVSALNLPWRR